jgi:hypothetical protein
MEVHLVALELDVHELELRALLDVERQVEQLRPAGHRRLLDVHRGVVVALLGVQLLDDLLDLPDGRLIDERVEPDHDAGVLQVLFDFRDLDFLGSRVVDDLEPGPLLGVVDDVFGRRAVLVRLVKPLNPKVVEKVS